MNVHFCHHVSQEWASDEMRERAAETAIAAGLAHLAPAIRDKQVPALRKGHLLFLANVWNFKSEIWRRKPQHLHAQLRQRHRSRCRTSVFQPTAKRAVPLPGEGTTNNFTASTMPLAQEVGAVSKEDGASSLVTVCEGSTPIKKPRINGVKEIYIKLEENGMTSSIQPPALEEYKSIRDSMADRSLINGRDCTPQSIYAARLSSAFLRNHNTNLSVASAAVPVQPQPQSMSRARLRDEIDGALAPLADTFLKTAVASDEFKQMVQALWNKNSANMSAFADLIDGMLATHAARTRQLRAEVRCKGTRDSIVHDLGF